MTDISAETALAGSLSKVVYFEKSMNGENLIRRFWLPAILLAVAIAVWSQADLVDRNNADALVLPLHGTTNVSPPFHVGSANKFRVSFEVAKRFAFHDVECLVGVGHAEDSSAPSPPTDCSPNFASPDARWEILADGRPIDCPNPFGLGAGGYSTDTIEREVCYVTLRPGVSYTARVWVQQPSVAWKQSAPKFTVRLDAQAGKEVGIYLALLNMIAAILAVCSVLTFAAALRRLVKYRTRPTV